MRHNHFKFSIHFTALLHTQLTTRSIYLWKRRW